MYTSAIPGGVLVNQSQGMTYQGNKMTTYTPGEVEKKTGINIRTIQRHIRKGLLEASNITPAGNRPTYQITQVQLNRYVKLTAPRNALK